MLKRRQRQRTSCPSITTYARWRACRRSLRSKHFKIGGRPRSFPSSPPSALMIKLCSMMFLRWRSLFYMMLMVGSQPSTLDTTAADLQMPVLAASPPPPSPSPPINAFFDFARFHGGLSEFLREG
jgi:hypothetical protein